MRLEAMRNLLRQRRGAPVEFTGHVIRDKIQAGFVQEEEIVRELRDPFALIHVREETPIKPGTLKYRLVFALSRAKELSVVVELNHAITVVTAYEVFRKVQERIRRIYGR